MARFNQKYTREYLQPLVAGVKSFPELCQYLGLQNGGGRMWVKGKIIAFGIDTSHFRDRTGWARGASNHNRRKTADQVLVILPSGSMRPKRNMLRRSMLESGVVEVCKMCGQEPTWRDKELVLIIDHIDGNWLDSRLSNLRFLCPNCESQTETHKNRKRKCDSLT